MFVTLDIAFHVLADQPPADDHEREQHASALRVRLDVGSLEALDHEVAGGVDPTEAASENQDLHRTSPIRISLSRADSATLRAV